MPEPGALKDLEAARAERQQQIDRQLAAEREQVSALETYLDRMSHLLLDGATRQDAQCRAAVRANGGDDTAAKRAAQRLWRSGPHVRDTFATPLTQFAHPAATVASYDVSAWAERRRAREAGTAPPKGNDDPVPEGP